MDGEQEQAVLYQVMHNSPDAQWFEVHSKGIAALYGDCGYLVRTLVARPFIRGEEYAVSGSN